MKGGAHKPLALIGYFAPSAVTFLMGVGGLILVDIVLGRYAPDGDLQDWILLKSLMLPLASLCLLGIDQVIVREPSKLHLFLRPVLVLALFIALIATAAIYFSGFYTQPFVLLLATLGIATSSLLFGMFRSNLSFNNAQFARDGWKFLLLLALVPFYFVFGFAIEWVLIGVLALTTTIMAWRKLTFPEKAMNEVHNEVHGVKSALRVSWPFWLAGVALSVASYGEILLLRGFGGTDLLPSYFRATILFAAPIVIFNTYITTFLGSAVRQRPQKYAQLMLRYRWLALIALPSFPVFALGFGYAISPLLFPAQDTPMAWAVLLSVTAGIRLGYSLLSPFIAALGNRRQITAVAVYYTLAAISTPLACFGLYWFTADLGLSVAATGALHWLGRSFIGWAMVDNLCKRHA